MLDDAVDKILETGKGKDEKCKDDDEFPTFLVAASIVIALLLTVLCIVGFCKLRRKRIKKVPYSSSYVVAPPPSYHQASGGHGRYPIPVHTGGRVNTIYQTPIPTQPYPQEPATEPTSQPNNTIPTLESDYQALYPTVARTAGTPPCPLSASTIEPTTEISPPSYKQAVGMESYQKQPAFNPGYM